MAKAAGIEFEYSPSSNSAEIFMAFWYAKVIGEIAEAGKREKNIPVYLNAWLEQHPDRAGIYPSGGPVAKMIPLWKKIAPSLDFISPDIYEPQFGMVCREYAVNGNPLFIPEAARNAKAASRVFYAFAAHHAIGFCPFGIEMLNQADEDSISSQQLAELNIIAEAMNASGTAKYLSVSYRILNSIYDRLADNAIGFIQEHPYDRGRILNGDELWDLRLPTMPSVRYVRLHTIPNGRMQSF